MAPPQITQAEDAVLYLRAVHSRTQFALTSFYLFRGARAGDDDRVCAIPGHAGHAVARTVEFSSICALSLVCRKVFDHATTGRTARPLLKASPENLSRVAEYWSSNNPSGDAHGALAFVRAVLGDLVNSKQNLAKSAIPLAGSVGRVKDFADSYAAHISMGAWGFSDADCAAVVSAMAVLASVIASFNNCGAPATYFDDVDAASSAGAVALFPDASPVRLFERVSIADFGRRCSSLGAEGRHVLYGELPAMLSLP